MTPRTCPGYCCEAFYLPFTPDEMTPPRMSHIIEGQYIRQMVLPLTADAAAMRRGYDCLEPPEEVGHTYSCRYFDERTRLCVQYESRPAMCRDYPYGKPCDHGCDYQVPR
jgi:Fe-S-cluster containining protein